CNYQSLSLAHPSPSMLRPPPCSTLFPYTTALPISMTCTHQSSPSGNRNDTALQSFRIQPPGNSGIFRDYSSCDSSRRCVQSSHRSEEHTSELQSPDHLVCRLLLEKKKYQTTTAHRH